MRDWISKRSGAGPESSPQIDAGEKEFGRLPDLLEILW